MPVYAAALLLGACATATIEDAVPVSGAAQQTVAPAAAGGEQAAADAAAESGAPRNTGQYPNLNVAPPAAATVLTPSETAAKTAEIRAAQQALATKGGSTPADEQARLRKLAQTHADEALKEIEE